MKTKNEQLFDINHIRFYMISVLKRMKRDGEARKRLLVSILGCICLWVGKYNIFHEVTSGIEKLDRITAVCFIYMIMFVLICIRYGTLGLNILYDDEFRSAAFVNHNGVATILIDRYGKGVLTLIFYSQGIDVARWKDKQEVVENILDMSIDSIELGRNNREIIVKGIKGRIDLNKSIEIESIDNACNSQVSLGEGVSGEITIDLNNTPHMLIAGSSGSGKTWLLKSVMFQLHEKGSVIYLADFKGGVDYPWKIWRNKVDIETSLSSLNILLNNLLEELEYRKELFVKKGYSNIEEYNKNNAEKLSRRVLCVDELAEITDKTGMDKEDKAEREKAIKALSQIARLGRAFGIHLILSTQRPDADVIPGQIKNNIDCRICGRADTVLSTIILGNGIADTKIPKDSQGIFITNKGELFRGFALNES